ncbi:uncharacterized protein M421DRAFT_56729 [Didymella exigua CBS 183.55]|uniref:Uncharacterized protein n=1 Tax=Didymella exigua CBS 183.55 TaxID=1150837 RepID=A0A6A5RUT0_9PLEO|nr:uncharacterized protein M421DRAFT_56729 [Didymella exigua CBS 183.55]KAF1931253.1 hypothetical protein M421DRAFT_56729 [Didymella exigua CBS 183.55]
MDDWQDHALSTRHMHNRNSRRGSGRGKKGAAFDVRKAFGEYKVKCAAWERALGELEVDGRNDDEAGLELLRLTEDGQGVLGELVLPGVLRASVVLAASRKTLAVTTRQLSGEDEDSDEGDEEGGSDDQDDGEDDGEEAPNRFATFEKNSFRSPKFWLAWNGTLTLAKEDTPPPSPALARKGSQLPTQQCAAEGLGYVTFTGNDCRKFKGTLSCRELGWKDVAVAGFKAVSRSESDRQVLWAGRDAETGWVEREDGDGDRGARVDARRRVIFD